LILPGSVPGADLQAISGDAPLRTSDQDLQALAKQPMQEAMLGLVKPPRKPVNLAMNSGSSRHAWESWKDIDEFYDEF
jgi:hypothetical protein